MIQFFINSNLFISLAAGILTLGTFTIFSKQQNYLAYLILVFSATLFDYNLHRIIKLKLNIGAQEKNNWVKKHFTSTLSISITSLLISIVSLFFIPTEIFGYLGVAGLLTILYSVPFKQLSIGKLDIRKIPFMKNVFIAAAWTIITFIIPIRYSGESLSAEVIIGIIQRFIFILALTIPFDISDIHEDKKQEFKTIPVLLGSNKSWLLANGLIVFFLASAIIHFPDIYSIVTILTSAATIIVFNYKRLQKSIYYNALWVDGTILLYGILLIIT